MVGGTAEVRSIEADENQPVYNLDVAEDRDFFVGTKGLLVHDFSFVQPVASRSTDQPIWPLGLRRHTRRRCSRPTLRHGASAPPAACCGFGSNALFR